VHEGRAGALLKGKLHTDELLMAVLDKGKGLRTERRLSHVFALDVPGQDRTLFVTDAAINISPDLEALNALAPELIIVGGRSSGKQAETSRIAPSIDMTIWGEDLIGQMRQRILDYGEIFDVADKAQALVSELDDKIESAKAAIEGKGNALILMTNGPKISVYGPGSRFGWVHTVLGVPAADPDIDAGEHGDAVSFEFVADIDPDWLIVVDRAAAIGSNEQNAKSTLDNTLIRQTKAWKSGQVIYAPSANVYIAAGGARATMEVIDSLAAGFSRAQ